MSVPETIASEQVNSTVHVEPMHQSLEVNLKDKVAVHQKKLLSKTTFCSPTDNLSSPCSSKLSEYKHKRLQNIRLNKLKYEISVSEH